MTEQEVTMTTELHDTECTTEINLSTPEDKTSVERTDTSMKKDSQNMMV